MPLQISPAFYAVMVNRANFSRPSGADYTPGQLPTTARPRDLFAGARGTVFATALGVDFGT